jgi:hypothetical protein
MAEASTDTLLGKRTRDGSASPPVGSESGHPEAKRTTKATSPVENGSAVPVQVDTGAESDDEVGPMPTGDESDDVAGPMPGGDTSKTKKKKKKAGEYSGSKTSCILR